MYKKNNYEIYNIRNFYRFSLTTWKKSDGVILLLEAFGHSSDPPGPLAESVSPSTIKEANEALTIALTENNTARLDLQKNVDVTLSKHTCIQNLKKIFF